MGSWSELDMHNCVYCGTHRELLVSRTLRFRATASSSRNRDRQSGVHDKWEEGLVKEMVLKLAAIQNEKQNHALAEFYFAVPFRSASWYSCGCGGRGNGGTVRAQGDWTAKPSR